MSKSTKSDKADLSIDNKPELPPVKKAAAEVIPPLVTEKEPEKKEPAPVATPLTTEEKVISFIESRKGLQSVRLNEFLKSLHPANFQDPSKGWKSQQGSKVIKGLLDKMQGEGLLKIKDDRHKLLGKFYYKNGEPETQYHDLDSIELLIVQ